MGIGVWRKTPGKVQYKTPHQNTAQVTFINESRKENPVIGRSEKKVPLSWHVAGLDLLEGWSGQTRSSTKRDQPNALFLSEEDHPAHLPKIPLGGAASLHELVRLRRAAQPSDRIDVIMATPVSENVNHGIAMKRIMVGRSGKKQHFCGHNQMHYHTIYFPIEHKSEPDNHEKFPSKMQVSFWKFARNRMCLSIF